MLEAIPGWEWDSNEAAWREGLARLRQYVEREGHANVPAGHTAGGFGLGFWVISQRMTRRTGGLSEEWRRMLEAFPGWEWDLIEAAWQEGLARLRQFVDREGHASVPQRYKEGGFGLGSWVVSRRTEWRTGRLSEERRRILEALPGWEWEPREATWKEGLARLRQFVDREGHASVPNRYTEGGFGLGNWVRTQRKEWRKGRLSEERRRMLEALPGWDWEPRSGLHTTP